MEFATQMDLALVCIVVAFLYSMYVMLDSE
jgi:hypothetical protein